METTLFAYQIVPGSDESLWFSASQEECFAAAAEQRRDIRNDDADDAETTLLGAMAVYAFTLRQPNHAEIIEILNYQTTYIQACAVDRRLVAVVAD